MGYEWDILWENGILMGWEEHWRVYGEFVGYYMVGFHSHGGTAIAGGFISWKIPSRNG